MSTVTKLKGSKLHFLKRRESDCDLSNGWKVRVRRLSGAKRASIEAMAFEMVETSDTKRPFKVIAKLERQGAAYCEAIAAMVIRVQDGDEVLENNGQPVFTPEEVGELDEAVFQELREIYEGAKVEGKQKVH